MPYVTDVEYNIIPKFIILSTIKCHIGNGTQYEQIQIDIGLHPAMQLFVYAAVFACHTLYLHSRTKRIYKNKSDNKNSTLFPRIVS